MIPLLVVLYYILRLVCATFQLTTFNQVAAPLLTESSDAASLTLFADQSRVLIIKHVPAYALYLLID